MERLNSRRSQFQIITDEMNAIKQSFLLGELFQKTIFSNIVRREELNPGSEIETLLMIKQFINQQYTKENVSLMKKLMVEANIDLRLVKFPKHFEEAVPFAREELLKRAAQSLDNISWKKNPPLMSHEKKNSILEVRPGEEIPSKFDLSEPVVVLDPKTGQPRMIEDKEDADVLRFIFTQQNMVKDIGLEDLNEMEEENLKFEGISLSEMQGLSVEELEEKGFETVHENEMEVSQKGVKFKYDMKTEDYELLKDSIKEMIQRKGGKPDQEL